VQKAILLVDDSSTLRTMVKICLKGLPYTLAEAENGKVALELLEQRTFDLILTDLNMPELDGFEFIAGARRLTSAETTPIVVMTSREAEDDIERAFTLGASSYVNKPVKKDELLAVVARHLG
jgi:two-component system, chemotaxis family, chemotaxis protein CheY